MESMIQYQERRREELRLMPHSVATAVRTNGEGSKGNQYHLNLTENMKYLPTKHRRVTE